MYGQSRSRAHSLSLLALSITRWWSRSCHEAQHSGISCTPPCPSPPRHLPTIYYTMAIQRVSANECEGECSESETLLSVNMHPPPLWLLDRYHEWIFPRIYLL